MNLIVPTFFTEAIWRVKKNTLKIYLIKNIIIIIIIINVGIIIIFIIN